MRHRKERKEGEKEKRRKGQKEVGRKTILETKLKYLSILFYLQKTHFIRFSSQDCPSLEKTMGVSERLYGWLPCSSPQHLLAAARRTGVYSWSIPIATSLVFVDSPVLKAADIWERAHKAVLICYWSQVLQLLYMGAYKAQLCSTNAQCITESRLLEKSRLMFSIIIIL